MNTYVGIDLGTTNSAICTYTEGKTKIWSYDQNSLYTPSAIYISKNGRKIFGVNAYNNNFRDPENAAVLFKRFLATTEIFRFKDSGIEMTPEECSAEILKLLYSYIPDDFEQNTEGIIITVPAAFNQMKKNATYEAAKKAGFKKVLLLQEPVAAIMAIMKNTKQKGYFIVYDLGGGTFDVSVAANTENKVSLLANGGIEMCGGKDLDRMIFNEIIVPWLHKHFNLPENLKNDNDFNADENYRKIVSLSMHCIEETKKVLDINPEANIILNTFELNLLDQNQNEIYIDTEISRKQINALLKEIIDDTVRVTKETVAKAGVNLSDIEDIVFIGGPTNYKPLRDLVSEALGVKQNNDVNPMTAVCEGAAVFAETIDWNRQGFSVKSDKDEKITDIGLKLRYDKRCSDDKARIAVLSEKDISGYTIEIINTDTGWTTGQMKMENRQIIYLPLNDTVNRFHITVLNRFFKKTDIGENIIEITKTVASVGAITAPKTLSIAYINKTSGQTRLDPIVRAGDTLPVKIQKIYKAGQDINAGSGEAVNLQIWEGDNFEIPENNTPVGTLKISGNDFCYGKIYEGDEINCEINISIGGDLSVIASVDSVGTQKEDNFYTRTSDSYNTDNPEDICAEAENLMQQIENMKQNIKSRELTRIYAKAKKVTALKNMQNCGKHDILKGYGIIDEVKQVLAGISKANKKEIRQSRLNSEIIFFNSALSNYATYEDTENYNKIIAMTQIAIERNDDNFEDLMAQLNQISTNIYFAQDHYIIRQFKYLAKLPLNKYTDIPVVTKLIHLGYEYMKKDRVVELKEIVYRLYSYMKTPVKISDFGSINITK